MSFTTKQPGLEDFDVIHVDVPHRYLRLTGAIRGYWRRELALAAAILILGVALGLAR